MFETKSEKSNIAQEGRTTNTCLGKSRKTCFATGGDTWGPMAHGDPMGTHGDPWGPMWTHGDTWDPWGPMGTPWGPHANPWAPMATMQGANIPRELLSLTI